MTDFVSHLDIYDEGKAMLVLAGVEMMQRQKPRWTPDDVAVLRTHYPVGGLAAMRTRLPLKTAAAIYQKAAELGLKSPFAKAPTGHRYFSSPHIDEAIRRYYIAPRRGGLSKLAHQLNRPSDWVSSRARLLGCVPPRLKEPQWSEDEIALLHKHAARPPRAISNIFAKHGFNRSPSGITNKMFLLKCDRSDDDHYTGAALARLFGVDGHLITSWIKRGLLKAKVRGTERERDIYMIHHIAVRRFVIENAGAVDIRRVEKHWFIDLLVGGK